MDLVTLIRKSKENKDKKEKRLVTPSGTYFNPSSTQEAEADGFL